MPTETDPNNPNPTGTKQDPPKADPPKSDEGKDGKGEKLLTQAEVNAIATREKQEGKAAAERAISEQLGCSIEEAKEILEAHRKAEEAKKDDATKAREAADKEKKAAEESTSAAAKEIFETRLERAFLREGVDFDSSDKDAEAKLARIRRMVTVEPGAEYDAILKDVQAIKRDFPQLFDTGDGDGTRRIPGSDPKGRPPKRTAGTDKMAAGRERALRHRGGSPFARRVPQDDKK